MSYSADHTPTANRNHTSTRQDGIP
jgi:hypothetical protein